ncbi:MRG-domain-containing protein [Calycina marina]|uniref:Chromatin modification-related protein EAF3 n=1 Tax=Calycina marina TaxID=1763456 RepID=A0A9P7Z9R3_9HELO|nr:MRG-domain-containing protein [Calycina marina]
MALTKKAEQPFASQERVLCFHHEMLYEAKVLDSRQTAERTWEFRIHYKGWKNTWDDWVPEDRVRKFNEENKELAQQLQTQARALTQKPKSIGAKKGLAKNGSDFSTPRGSEERYTSAAPLGRGRGRNRDYDLEHEENFLARPSIKLLIPDHIKAMLVDDWENVTKNLQLVPLPSHHSVNKILDDYLALERPKRREGSTELDVLEEVVLGLKEYFDKCLGRILLYRFERPQYMEMVAYWKSTKPSDHEEFGKGPGDTYGAEHLCRLLVSLPELIGQTNIDSNSVNRLREELSKMTNWLGRNATTYFVSDYETPTSQYIEKARGV